MKKGVTCTMRLLAILHGHGVNLALLAGLVLMPLIVAVGFWADGSDALSHLGLRGSLDAAAAPGASFAALPPPPR